MSTPNPFEDFNRWWLEEHTLYVPAFASPELEKQIKKTIENAFASVKHIVTEQETEIDELQAELGDAKQNLHAISQRITDAEILIQEIKSIYNP